MTTSPPVAPAASSAPSAPNRTAGLVCTSQTTPLRPRFPGEFFFALRRDPLAFLTRLARDHGDFTTLRFAGQNVVLINHPDLIHDVLVADAASYSKGVALRRARLFLGESLLTSEGAKHRRQRRLVQPALHRQRLAGYADAISASAVRAVETWTPGTRRDVAADMAALTLDAVCRTLFSADVADSARTAGAALGTLIENFNRILLPFSDFALRLPLPASRRIRAARTTLDEIVFRLIRERRAGGGDTGDLLSTLVFAEDADRPGERLSDEETRDQVMTLFLAGHETTANALAWTWSLLAENPAAECALHAELAAVLGGRAPTFADVPRLVFTEQVVRESLRLYPPAWIIGRRALIETELGGRSVAAGTTVLTSPWVTHRDARWFESPAAFCPWRWTPALRENLPKFSYLPFGGGPRGCIGESFAWMELILVVATLAQQWRFRPAPGTRPPAPQPRITLRPTGGLPMLVERRA